MKVVGALLIVAAPIAVRAANGGHTNCACLDTPTDGNQTATQADGKPSYPTEIDSYGYGCQQWDKGYDACNITDDEMAQGKPSDWCAGTWCIVDPASCDFRSLHVSYTGQPNDYFSYEACDLNYGTTSATFAGNGWVGRCKNCEHVETGGDRTGANFEESFCSCGGTAGCPCMKGVTKATQAADKPEYPAETPSYGYGCKAHDSGALRPSGSDTCANGTMTSAGEANDWCEDKWCIVDKDNCDLTNVLEVGYTGDATDYFTYLACDTSFAGNGWVGRNDCPSGWTDDPCPTLAPAAAPTLSPTAAPPLAPTAAPTLAPTAAPTDAGNATAAPTAAPTDAGNATAAPTAAPSPAPTDTDSASKAIPALICGAVFAAVAAF